MRVVPNRMLFALSQGLRLCIIRPYDKSFRLPSIKILSAHGKADHVEHVTITAKALLSKNLHLQI